MIYFVGLGIHFSKQQTLAGPQCTGNRAEQLGSFSLSWEPLLVCYLLHLQARPSSIAMTWTPRSILSPPMASHPSRGISGLDLPRVLHLCIQLLSLQDSMDQKKFFLIKTFIILGHWYCVNLFLFISSFIYLFCQLCSMWGLSSISACGDQRSISSPLQWKHRDLTIAPPGNSLQFIS